MSKKFKVLKYLEVIAPILPTPIVWTDLNSIVLGINELGLKAIGITREAIIGKCIHDLYPKEIADHIREHDKKVIEQRKIMSQEEKIVDVTTGNIKYFTAVKAPLYENEEVIGIIITGVDITAEKEAEHLKKNVKILEHFETVASCIPAPLYWLDRNSVVLGGNEALFKQTGGLTRKAFIGKTAYDLYPNEMAQKIIEHNKKVINTGETSSQEEVIQDITTGKIKYFTAIKSPLRDDDGKIIGLVGTSIDITAEKEAEKLELEYEIQKKSVQEQEKFVKISNQVAHDIRSPLASLLMIVKSCKEIPEGDRIALREAAIGIGDIANNLLSKYQKKETEVDTEEKQSILVSVVLLQLLTEKKYQYQNLPVKFDYDFASDSYFSFIKLPVSAFKRMLSNLMNNAVDAFEKKPGKINIKLAVNLEWVEIIIQDNGKGMPKEIVDKILQNIAVTAGKSDGHGIGLTQVRETLQNNQGEMTINSEVGKGTEISITFPRIKTPHWIAEEIVLRKDDIIIILDDDSSIHGAWNTHFEPILKQAPALQIKHFTIGNEALNYINHLPEEEKNKIFLLTDYELLKQELNGLHVVAQSGVKRSILVTSHYAQLMIQNQAAKTGTKILPKQLASEIPIKITEIIEIEKSDSLLTSVDIILVDDDEKFVKNLITFAFAEKTVDKYYDPDHFLANVEKYPKNTKICLDNNFAAANMKGVDIAKILHEKGFTRLYILSGDVFDKNHLPEYIIAIRKDDIESLQDL